MPKKYYIEYRKKNKDKLRAAWERWAAAHPEVRRRIARESYHRRKQLKPVKRVPIDEEILSDLAYPKLHRG